MKEAVPSLRGRSVRQRRRSARRYEVGRGYPRSPIGEVADRMVETGVGRIPIVAPDTLRVVGILSRHDLLKARSTGTRAERDRTRGSVRKSKT